MDNCYSIGHIAEDHKNTNIRWNTEEPKQKYRLGTISNRLFGWRVLPDPNARPYLLQWFETFGPHESFLTHK